MANRYRDMLKGQKIMAKTKDLLGGPLRSDNCSSRIPYKFVQSETIRAESVGKFGKHLTKG